MPILSNLIVRIGASTDDFDKTVDRSLNKVKRFASDVTAAGTALSIGFSAPLIVAGAAAIKAGSDMESLTMGLKAVMKSSEATATEVAKLREVAKLPGLGLEEAVKGTIRLQILGNSADQSRRIMGELGNALAVVGGGREDFNEVIRQLSQLGAVGKVTKENLDPIIERIPQLAAIIKEKFGPEALGDTAKTFERMGISSQQFIAIITDELAKGERAGNTYKNSWTNIEQAAKDAAAEFGKTLLPIAQRVLDDFLTPGIEQAKALATAFRDLPQPTQDWALGLTAVATAAPLALVALGTLIEKGALVVGVLNKGIPLLKGFAASLSLAGVAAGAAAAGVGLFLKWLIDHGGKPVDTTAEAVKNLNKNFDQGAMSSGAAGDMLIGYMKVMAPAEATVNAAAEAHGKLEKQVTLAYHAHKAAKPPTMDLLALFERFKDVAAQKTKAIDLLAQMMDRYGTVTEAATIRAAKGMDLLFRSFRQLSAVPDIDNLAKLLQIDFSKLPKVQGVIDSGWDPKLSAPMPGDWEAFKGGSKNIGPEGMMTKEQHAAITARYKDLGKVGKAAMQQVSTVITDLSRGITDVIFKGGKLTDMFKNVDLQAAQSITRLLIEGALTKLTSKLLDVGGLMGKVFGGATSVGGSVFSAASSAGGSVAGAAGSAAGGIGSAAGGIAGGAGQAAGALASGGITAIVGAVSGVVSAVSGVISNFQFMAMNKTLDLIEHEVRYSQIHLLHTLNKANEFWPYMKTCWESLIRMEQRQMAVGAGSGASVVINLNGGDPKAALEEITRTLKQFGVIPRG